MSKIDERFLDYGLHHQTIGNRVTHFFGIPFIVLSLLGLLDKIILIEHVLFGLPLTAAMVAFVATAAYYIYLDAKLGIFMVVFLSVLYWVALHLSLYVLIAILVVGWALQFYGHYRYEKQRPAFMHNLEHLLIGPAYIVNKIVKVR